MKNKGLEKLRQFATLNSSELSRAVDDAAIGAIEISVLDGNISVAQQCLSWLIDTKEKKYAQQLCLYFQEFGNMRYESRTKTLWHHKKLKKEDWTKEYAETVAKYNWRAIASLVDPTSKQSANLSISALNVEEELRKLLDQLDKKAAKNVAVLFHAGLINQVRRILSDYNFSEDHEKEESRYKKTLFDKSTAMKTMRGNKYAQDLECNQASK